MAVYSEVLLKKGTHEADLVRILKEQLNKQGFAALDINNPNFGDSTEAAVIRFQKAKLLNPDGEVGPLTWHRLFSEREPVTFQSTVLREVAIEFALSQLYVREQTGKNDGADVEKYLQSVGLGKGYAWCVAFQFWNFEQAAKRLNVKNPLPKTAGVLDLWNKTPENNKVTNPQKGDLGFMDFGHGKGHIFLVKKREGINLATVEGNTSGDPTSAVQDRDGQGVFERLRKTTSKQIVGYARF